MLKHLPVAEPDCIGHTPLAAMLPHCWHKRSNENKTLCILGCLVVSNSISNTAHLADAALAVGVQDELAKVGRQVHQRHIVAAAERQALQLPQPTQTPRQACSQERCCTIYDHAEGVPKWSSHN